MTQTWDVIVVGAGTAGMPLAIFAAQRGARVLVIEHNDHLGGQLHWSSGQISAAGTRLQSAKGIRDTPQQHFADALRISRGTVDAEAIRVVIDNAAATLHWLLDHGYTVMPDHPIVYLAHEPYSVPRTYFGPDKAVGIFKAMLPLYQAQQQAGRIHTRLSTDVTALRLDAAGAVVGIEHRSEKGEAGTAEGRNIVLATGGFARNHQLFRDWIGYPLYSWCSEHSQGLGHLLGLEAGGVLRHGEKFLCTFAGIHNPKAPGQHNVLTHLTPQLRQPWEIYVNLDGERFMREDEPSVDAREHALMQQRELAFWAIYDAGIVDAASSPFFFGLSPAELTVLWNTHPSFKSAPSASELAHACGMPDTPLMRTLAEYNQAVEFKRDAAFERQHLPRRIDTGPLYAVLHHGISVVGWAGLDTDSQLRVLSADGQPIRNLYAVGEVRGFGLMNGNAFIGGMGLQPALTMGRLLGQRMLHW
jgi:fumarate reductase flavoprotein subunit